MIRLFLNPMEDTSSDLFKQFRKRDTLLVQFRELNIPNAVTIRCLNEVIKACEKGELEFIEPNIFEKISENFNVNTRNLDTLIARAVLEKIITDNLYENDCLDMTFIEYTLSFNIFKYTFDALKDFCDQQDINNIKMSDIFLNYFAHNSYSKPNDLLTVDNSPLLKASFKLCTIIQTCFEGVLNEIENRKKNLCKESTDYNTW